MSQDYALDEDIDESPEELAEVSEPTTTRTRGRSQDFEEKRRRAERILEQARIRELLGYDVDYQD